MKPLNNLHKMFNVSYSENSQSVDTTHSLLYQQVTLILMLSLNAITLYNVPSWDNAFTDPCKAASIFCGITVLFLFITRFIEQKAKVFEPIAMALFLAGMPVIYILSCLTKDGTSLWLAVEIIGLPIYLLFTILGLKRSPWFLVIGIALHGLAWDIWHYSNSTYIPNWYAIGCLVADVSISIYISSRIPLWESLKNKQIFSSLDSNN